MSFSQSDSIVCPTKFQAAPSLVQKHINIIHDGLIQTELKEVMMLILRLRRIMIQKQRKANK